MTQREDLTGRKFGRLTVTGRSQTRLRGEVAWDVRCECGTEKALIGYVMTSGNTRSCGCLFREVHRDLKAQQNRTHGMTNTPEYRSYQAMQTRCQNQSDPAYPSYGGRGITVCDRWRDSFENFLSDMGQRPAGTTLDRYPDNDGNYEPGNCRWATKTEQNRNKRNSVTLTLRDATKCITEWTEITGIPARTLRRRLELGWSHERALGTPVQARSAA